jgi:hypothetical protein
MKITTDIRNFYSLLPAVGLPGYLTALNDCIDYGYFVENNCVLPYTIRKRAFIKFLQFTSPVCGAQSIEEEKQFLNSVVKFVQKKMNVDFLESINTAIFNTFPDESLYCKFGSYIIDLSKSEDELFAGLHSKHRNVIRKAQKDGLVVLYGNEYMLDCFNLINETFARQGMLAPKIEYIKRLTKLNDNVSFVVVKLNDKIEGSAILLWNKEHSCYYLHGGSVHNSHGGAMNLLHWETMLRMKANGVKYYDFVGGRLNPEEGSRLEGIQRFKSRFGGNFRIGYLWKLTISKYKTSIYFSLLKIYFENIRREKFTGDAIDQERAKGNY